MSTDNLEQPLKRKSVADMWRQREKAMLDKDKPYLKTSPARRSFKTYEEKKSEGAATTSTNNSADGLSESTDNAASKGDTGEGSAAASRSLSAKNKFAMMGQRHAARPKKLATYQAYQQPKKDTNPISPASVSSDVILDGAFDDTVGAEEGSKLHAELSSKRRAQQSEGLASKGSEYASLQVSDSTSIPKDAGDVGGVDEKKSADNEQKDDDYSLISGLSSPGSPTRSYRQRRRSQTNQLPSPQESRSIDQETYDSEGYSTVTHTTVTPESGRKNRGLDRVSAAVVAEGFVEESDNNVSAFQDAMQKMSLAEIVNDVKEATGVFGGVNMTGISSNLNESMTTAKQTFSSLFSTPTNKEEAPKQAEKQVESATPAPVVGEAVVSQTPAETEGTEAKTENMRGGNSTNAIAGFAEPGPDENAEPEVKETTETATYEAEVAPLNNILKTASEDEAPDPPLVAADSDSDGEDFDPFANTNPTEFTDFAAFPTDAFSNHDFAASKPAPVPPRKKATATKSPARRKGNRPRPASEKVAIEVEYMASSDDEQAEV